MNINNFEFGEVNGAYFGEKIWYKKYLNGFIEYWGICSSPGQGAGGKGYGTIDFPVPFKSVYDYVVTSNSEYASSGTPLFLTGTQKITASRVYIYTYSPYVGTSVTGAWINWEARGRWK